MSKNTALNAAITLDKLRAISFVVIEWCICSVTMTLNYVLDWYVERLCNAWMLNMYQ